MTSSTLDKDSAALSELLTVLGREAQAFRFEVAPNPCVGAAVLAGGVEVARGFHRVWGGPHAEVEALEAARAAARLGGPGPESWDTLVVTLEPCSSTGKTPPCVDAIVAAGIRTVVVGALDPDPRHRGRGLEKLREAGLEVALIDGPCPLESVAPHFLRWTSRERLRRPRPWTVAKWAQTLSGHLRPPKDVGDGRWISGPGALAEVHELRGRVDAILTGVGTVLADDPRMTLRPQGSAANLGGLDPVGIQPPQRIVFDSWLRTPPDARLFAPAEPGEFAGGVVILSLPAPDVQRRRRLEAAGAEVVEMRGTDRKRLHLRTVHEWLMERGLRRVLLESGPELLRAHLTGGFVDQVRVVTGDVRGGRGESLASWLATADLQERLDREVAPDAVLEAFLESK